MPKVGLDIAHGVDTFPPDKGVYVNGVGYPEHSFSSKLSLYMIDLLEMCGIEVVLAQKPFAKDVPLMTRTNYYANQNVDLIFSCHANAGVSSAEGRCAFYWHTSSKSKKLAQDVIAEMKALGYSTHGNGLHASMLNSWTNLHICRESNEKGIPAVLVEHGFMTNKKDFELIFGSKQDQYIEDMAVANVKAICKFFGIPFKREVGNMSQEKLNPSESALNKAVQGVLHDWEKDEKQPLSDMWRKKFEKRELTVSDAVGLLFIGVQRGYIK